MPLMRHRAFFTVLQRKAAEKTTRLTCYQNQGNVRPKSRGVATSPVDVQLKVTPTKSTKNSSNEGYTPTKWPLSRFPTSTIIRTIFLSQTLSRPWLARFGMKALGRIANSKGLLLDPDRNPVLGRVLRACIYNQFCVGSEKAGIKSEIAKIKDIGHTGVILNYARETMHHELADELHEGDLNAAQIENWRQGNMDSLAMLSAGDYLAVKFTGAGDLVSTALTNGEKPPEQFWKALDDLCAQAQRQGTRIFVDAEQMVYQPTIDQWTVDMMRKYNKMEPILLNTYQAYLKTTRANIRRHAEIASKEGWIIAMKLVRGAYISNEQRDLIHDTKQQTDDNYNSIARDLLSRDFDGLSGESFPRVKLLLAGHNAESIRRAAAIHRDLVLEGREPGVLEFGQTWGTADHVSGELIARGEDARNNNRGLEGRELELERQAAPLVFKCVNWGTVRECIHYLMRRATENAGSTDRLHDGLEAAKRELKARVFGRWS